MRSIPKNIVLHHYTDWYRQKKLVNCWAESLLYTFGKPPSLNALTRETTSTYSSAHLGMQNGLESRSQDTAAKLLCYKGEEDCLKNFYSTNHPPFQNLIIQYLFIKIWKCIMILFPPNAAGLHTHMYSKDKLIDGFCWISHADCTFGSKYLQSILIQTNQFSNLLTFCNWTVVVVVYIWKMNF